MHTCLFYFRTLNHTVEDSGESHSESENSVSDSIDDNDDSVAEISRSFRSRQELCEQLNVNHMIQRIFLITLDNSESNTLHNAYQWFDLSDAWTLSDFSSYSVWAFVYQYSDFVQDPASSKTVVFDCDCVACLPEAVLTTSWWSHTIHHTPSCSGLINRKFEESGKLISQKYGLW